MSRTLVLRCHQRPMSRTVTLTAHLEIDGHLLPTTTRTRAISAPTVGTFDEVTIGAVMAAVRAAMTNAEVELPFGGGIA